MRRICLTVAYDGTDFAGFQQQPMRRTVEGELNRALSELTGERVQVIGASRTDSGVHARGNLAVFDTNATIPADRMDLAVLPYLPQDLKVVCAREVPPDWHPRHQHCLKTYEYTFQAGRIEDPFYRRYASFVKRPLDISLMQAAAAVLVGTHDFTSFANPSSQVLLQGGSAVRSVYGISVIHEPHPYFRDSGNAFVKIRVTGDGFLYNMVRIIAGTLQLAGHGAFSAARMEEALLAKDRTKAGPTAEARGLTLCGIEYPDPQLLQ